MPHATQPPANDRRIVQFGEPTQKLEALVKNRQVEHGGHPILRAHAEAVAVKTNVNENLRPVKDHSTGRIDGIVALIMALSRAMRYEKREYARPFVAWV